MNTLYKTLVDELNKTNLSFESDEQIETVFVEYERDAFALMQINNNKFIAGVGYYCEKDNFFDYTNVRCPEFENVDEAIDWLSTW